MTRKVTTLSKLGLAIRNTGKPMYKVAGETDIAYARMAAYVAMRQSIRIPDLMKLSDYFGLDPEDLIGPNDDVLHA
jgi:hypothetical protein